MIATKPHPTQTKTQRTPDQLAHVAVELAAELLAAGQSQQTTAERQQGEKMAEMMADPLGKIMTISLSDQAFRSHDPARINDQIRHLIEGYGVPSYLAGWEQAALNVGTLVGELMPQLVVPFITAKLKSETQNVILSGEEKPFRAYLNKRHDDGTRLNLNYLGEAILGETEAERRHQAYLDLLARPDVEYISVKISSIFSQINMAAFAETVEQIKVRLRELYSVAAAHRFTARDGSITPKFINLDMEEYRDLHMTVAAFQQVLDEPEFFTHRAGIVLQAYLPDSHRVQQQLTEWAKERVANGGAPIKVRIVKGANLAMERVEASMHHWEQAPYYTKADVDANFKRMVLYGCDPENAPAVNIGLASHNLFDIAFGLVTRADRSVQPYVELEMLEGMANHQARAVKEHAGGLLLYAPVVKQEDFHSAIAYLVRRLDENTSEENFLHDLFGLKVGDAKWEKQKALFLEAVERRDIVSTQPNRTQNRLTESITFDPAEPFANQADTDFSLPANQQWIRQIVDAWQLKEIPTVPLQINGEFLTPNEDGTGVDPSHPNQIAYRYARATAPEIESAIATAETAQKSWCETPIAERKAILIRAAEELAAARGDLIGAAILDGGKTSEQADVEVTEAIDFALYYPRSFDDLDLDKYEFSPLGTVLVTPPWNFPIAIPCGGVLSALMAGNSVILKPAPEAVLVAWHLVSALYTAGVPHSVLQFVPTTDDEIGRALVTDSRIDAVILTGGYETAQLFLSWKPEMNLLAETSGKNALIVSALADHDLAIKDLVYSAFGHNGQKCSAASLAILEAEVYDNPAFMRQLKDAAASLPVGSAWDLSSRVTPLIHAPNQILERALTQLADGEEWLLQPKMIDGNPNLWSPGIVTGVQRGSFLHRIECFGPVLAIMRAENLDEAIEIVNESDFGLTSGLHSLDDREISLWREKIEAGNAYINRGTTGAIVERQPFGGWKKSAFGSGAKGGGPNYVLSLGTWADRAPQDDLQQLAASRASYQQAWATHFRLEHDPSSVMGESNIFRYRPLNRVALRIDASTPLLAILQAAAAAQICGVPLVVSAPANSDHEALKAYDLVAVVESETELADRIQVYDRIRHLADPTPELLTAAHEAHVPILRDRVTSSGRLELRYYLREQSMTELLHRYGNIIPKPEM